MKAFCFGCLAPCLSLCPFSLYLSLSLSRFFLFIFLDLSPSLSLPYSCLVKDSRWLVEEKEREQVGGTTRVLKTNNSRLNSVWVVFGSLSLPL